jgi:uncharacterized protein
VRFEWDATKAATNAVAHGVSFEAVSRFEFASAFTTEDDRMDYGEARWRSIGLIELRLHVLVSVQRDAAIRVISLHNANAR